jgi:hypothetical protein
MNVYVESNFVLEHALEQEEYDSCSEIIQLASQGRITLLKGKAGQTEMTLMRAHHFGIYPMRSTRVISVCPAFLHNDAHEVARSQA